MSWSHLTDIHTQTRWKATVEGGLQQVRCRNTAYRNWCFLLAGSEYTTAVVAIQLAISQYPKGPATGHLNTGFSWFPWVQERMLKWFPPFQVASTCFSCSPPDLSSIVTNCLLSYYVKWPLPPGENPTAVNKYYYCSTFRVWVRCTLPQGKLTLSSIINYKSFQFCNIFGATTRSTPGRPHSRGF